MKDTHYKVFLFQNLCEKSSVEVYLNLLIARLFGVSENVSVANL